MDKYAPIPDSEKLYIRELAKKQLEYAQLPVMEERKRLWYLHNKLQGERPMVVLEEGTFLWDIMPPMRCKHPLTAGMEQQLCQNIAAHETFDDDKVVPDFFTVYCSIRTEFLGLHQKRASSAGGGPGFQIQPLFESLEEGLPMIQHSTFIHDSEDTALQIQAAQDVLGDILPVVKKNAVGHWFGAHTYRVVEMMGMENMYLAMMTEPDEFHTLMRLITEDFIRSLRWQEEQQLLFLNNGNDFMGAGSYCFSDELPPADFTGRVRSADTWGHINSQESVGISPEQFAEFVYPYCEQLAKEYGLVYFGCCEPVHGWWDKGLSGLPNLRKLSISAWCDEDAMGERLTGTRVIYSRKPPPHFLGVHTEFDENAFTAHIKKTASAVKSKCKAEIIFRDIYTLHGNLAKTRQAVDITRRIMETVY